MSPPEVVTAEPDCTTGQLMHDESAPCFGPYETTGGATKVEGFD